MRKKEATGVRRLSTIQSLIRQIFGHISLRLLLRLHRKSLMELRLLIYFVLMVMLTLLLVAMLKMQWQK